MNKAFGLVIKYVHYAFWILIVISLITLIFFAYRFFTGDKSYNIDVSQSAVIKELRSLNRLETASFTIEKIIEAGTDGGALSQVLFGDRILLIAHGEVIAGFDLSKLNDDSVDISGEKLTLNLPPPQILITRLDSQKTRVYDREQGFLTKGDKDLESQARSVAEDEITKAACEGEILNEATDNGRSQMTALLKTLGFTTVIVNIPSASCA